MEAASHFSLLLKNPFLHSLSGVIQTALDGSLAALGQTGYISDAHFVHIVGDYRRLLQHRQPLNHLFYNLYRFLSVQRLLRQTGLILLRQRLKFLFSILAQQHLMGSPKLLAAQIKYNTGDPFPKVPAVLKAIQAIVGRQIGVLNQVQGLLLIFRDGLGMEVDQTVGLLI